jgi:glycosyltransferase involved in cell wall biosynthesis
MKLDGLTFIFPCYNEEGNIRRVLLDAVRIAPVVAEKFEFLVIDDGSRDGTARVVREMMDDGVPVRLLQHPGNRGYGEALKTGFAAARLPWMFFTDGDGQFTLAELPGLVRLSEGADIVAGYRMARADPLFRDVLGHTFNGLLRIILGLQHPDVDCAFKLLCREKIRALHLRTSGALINAEILCKVKARGGVVRTIGVQHHPRIAGSATGGSWRVIRRAMREFWLLWRDPERLSKPR